MNDLFRLYRPIQPSDAGRAQAAYRELPPCAALSPFVACYWGMERQGGSAAGYTVVPDGCTDMLFQWVPGGAAVRSSLCGTFETPFEAISSPERTRYFGIRFFPGGLYRLLGIPASEYSGRLLPLNLVLDAAVNELTEKLSGCLTFEEQTAVADTFLSKRAGTIRRPDIDPNFGNALRDLLVSGGVIPVSELASRCAVSERQLHRLFVKWTGLGPKPLGRIVRFQRVLESLNGGAPDADWAGTALAFGYADQAHMIRDFKSLYGKTPAEAARATIRETVRIVQYSR